LELLTVVSSHQYQEATADVEDIEEEYEEEEPPIEE
jgi:hypothetical protein